MDIRIWSAIISATVAIIIAVLNHFVIAPIKEKRNRKREQIKNLYAPLYGVINVMLKTNIDYSLQEKKLLLIFNDGIKYQSQDFVEVFLVNNSGYCSNELLESWIIFSSGFYRDRDTERFVMTIVKDYNQLKRDLNIPYNKEELRTGIPESIKQYRKFVS